LEGNHRAVAILLALAAIVGIALGARASLIRSSATDAWQGALRAEIKRAAAAVEDVRYVYVAEAPVAFQVDEAKLRAAEARRAAVGVSGVARRALLVEARTQELVAENLGQNIQAGLANPRYETKSGGFDAPRRLADQRSRYPNLVKIDPEQDQGHGDRLSQHAFLDMAATIPAALAFMLGAFAEAFGRRRRPLLAAGFVALVAAFVLGAVIEGVYA
jgi:hypothetical protein